MIWLIAYHTIKFQSWLFLAIQINSTERKPAECEEKNATATAPNEHLVGTLGELPCDCKKTLDNQFP